MKKMFKKEKGSIAIYAIATVFSFIFILTGLYVSSASVRRNELKTLRKIKEVYAQQITYDVNK